MEVSEGRVTVAVPEQSGEGKEGVVFFNAEQELNRDLTVAVLRAWAADREERGTEGADPGPGSYLDATAASGVRGVRAAANGWDATCCDYDPAAVDLARENFARNDLEGRVERRDARPFMYEERFDVVDVDPFGTPMPFAEPAFDCAHELVCATATDTAPLCGAHFDSGVRTYGAVPRNTEYHAEMGLRVLLGALARTAARFDVGVTPVLTHATRHYVRTYLAVSGRATDANAAIDELGHVEHCQDCRYRETTPGLIADPLESCPECGSARVVTAGPLWLGATRDTEFTARVREHVSDDMGTAERARGLLETIEAELDRPTHYDQHKLSKQWGVGAIGMDAFCDRLRDAGFEASRTHFGGTTVKTDATPAEMRAATVDAPESAAQDG